MADNLPRSSSTVEVYEVIGGLLEKLQNGSLTRETAYSKKRKMAVRYHSEDIEKCYHKVRRLNNYATVMTVTDLEKNLDETQDALEDEIIGLQDSEKSQKQIIVFKNEEIRRKDGELRRKDDELRQKDDELRRKDDELSRKDEELDRLRRLLGQG
ncbi:regulator of chromosome segregation-like [Mytilus edulis]|uniref:regulator of chromosome segregation-like n=1 Tax=Mytilus edulis TaxID=6550 RepID=UPI0039EFB9B1